jgi:hypothetical protein
LSASDAIKKVIPPERQLNLPELTSNESLSVQTETVRLNGQTTINLVEKLLAMTTNLTAEVIQLRLTTPSSKSKSLNCKDFCL